MCKASPLQTFLWQKGIGENFSRREPSFPEQIAATMTCNFQNSIPNCKNEVEDFLVDHDSKIRANE